MSYPRILCPWHEEKTPSCVVYPDGKIWCFGCSRGGYAKDLGLSTPAREPRENLAASLRRIASLPKERIRGLELPVDENWYYVVWPGNKYYKRRSKTDNGSSKYIGPRGHPKPLFTACVGKSDTLLIVEGEINALSAAQALPFDVVSPGSATDFRSKATLSQLPKAEQYRIIIIVVDADAPGMLAAMRLKASLLPYNPNIALMRVQKDLNEVLVKDGEQGIKALFAKYLAL